MPSPPRVNGTELARMRKTSAKAKVTSAKYEPRNPARKLSTPMPAPTAPPAAMAIGQASQGFSPYVTCRMVEAYAPVPKNTTWPNDSWPAKPPAIFQLWPR
jgi:hypothetical protein